MYTHKEIILTILAMTGVNFFLRLSPIFLIPGRWLQCKKVVAFFRYIPVAVIAAMVATMIFIHEDKINFAYSNPNLLAAVPVVIMASWTKNIFATIVVGVLAFIMASSF